MPNILARGPRERAEILIHESAHLVGMSVSTDDVYQHTQRFRGLGQEEAMLNSDSYALFASAASQGVPLSVPLAFGATGGVVGGGPSERGWLASLYLETTFEHPILHVFNPTLRVSMTMLDVRILHGWRDRRNLTFPRIRQSSSDYCRGSAWKTHDLRGTAPDISPSRGPTFNVRGADTAVAESGVAAGFHWRSLDVGIGATYFRDPTAREAGAISSNSVPPFRSARGSVTGSF